MKIIIILLILGMLIGFSALGSLLDFIWFAFSVAVIAFGIISMMAGFDEKKEGKDYRSTIEGGIMFIGIGVISLIVFLSFC